MPDRDVFDSGVTAPLLGTDRVPGGRSPGGTGDDIVVAVDDVRDFTLAPSVDRNAVLNGAFALWQNYAAATVSAGSSSRVYDVWNLTVDGTTVQYFANNTGSEGLGPATTYRSLIGSWVPNTGAINCTANKVTLASGDAVRFTHVIPGERVWPIGEGKIVLSFVSAHSITGTYGVYLRNISGTAHIWVDSYTQAVANVWEAQEIVIDELPSTVTWTAGAGGLELGFVAAAHSGLVNGAPQTWNANRTLYAVSGQTNNAAINGAWHRISAVQLERGTQRSRFEHRDVGAERLRIGRQYWTTAGDFAAAGTTVRIRGPINGINYSWTPHLYGPMMATPSMTVTVGTNVSYTSHAVTGLDANGFELQLTTTAVTGYGEFSIISDARL